MAELDDLKERIEDAIHQNGRGEITGSVLQEVLLDMVDTISENADVTGQLATVATTGSYNDLSNKPTLQARVEGETLILNIG